MRKVSIRSVRSETGYQLLVGLTYLLLLGFAVLDSIAYGFLMGSTEAFFLAVLVLGLITLLIAIGIHVFLQKFYYRPSIVVLDNRVYCTSIFDHETRIPVDQISSVSVNSKWGQSITLTSAGFRFHLGYLSNCMDVYRAINIVINNLDGELISDDEAKAAQTNVKEKTVQQPKEAPINETPAPSVELVKETDHPNHNSNKYYDNFWICGNCKTKNLTSREECWGCGHKK